MKIRIIMGALIVLTLIACGSAVYFWYHKPPVSSQVEYVKVPEIKTVTKIQKVFVPGPGSILTVEKQVVVEKLSLPDWIKQDENKQVIATAEIAPYEGKTNAVAIMDTKTGVSEIIAKQIPLSLFGFENKKEIGIRAGVDLKGEPLTSIYGRWDFLRIGNARIGVYGEANSKGDASAQMEVGYRF
jgi:hypothetical protein